MGKHKEKKLKSSFDFFSQPRMYTPCPQKVDDPNCLIDHITLSIHGQGVGY